MEEKKPPQKQIVVTEATIMVANVTVFKATPNLLKRLSERASKEQELRIPQELPDGNCTFTLNWIEE